MKSVSKDSFGRDEAPCLSTCVNKEQNKCYGTRVVRALSLTKVANERGPELATSRTKQSSKGRSRRWRRTYVDATQQNITLQGLLGIKDTHRPQEGPMILGIELP